MRSELVEHAAPVVALALELRAASSGSSSQRKNVRSAASLRTRRSGSVSPSQRRISSSPASVSAYVFELRAPASGLLDEAVLEQARELGVDLAVARRPRVRERLLEVLEERVAGSGPVGERSEKGVAE